MSKNQEILLTDSAVDFLKEKIGQGIEYVTLKNTTGELTNEIILKARSGEVLFRYFNEVFLHSGFIAGYGDVYSTAINQDGNYLQMKINTRSYLYEIKTVNVGGDDGTTVVANPTLSGTEANLTGLQVDETKYKVPTTALGQIITVDETNFTVYDWFFNTPIDKNQTLYRVGIVFRNKNTNEDYVIVCTTDKNIDNLDSEDPGFFQQCIGMVRGGDLVLYSQSLTHLGVVCQHTTSESTYTEIRMLM